MPTVYDTTGPVRHVHTFEGEQIAETKDGDMTVTVYRAPGHQFVVARGQVSFRTVKWRDLKLALEGLPESVVTHLMGQIERA